MRNAEPSEVHSTMLPPSVLIILWSLKMNWARVSFLFLFWTVTAFFFTLGPLLIVARDGAA